MRWALRSSIGVDITFGVTSFRYGNLGSRYLDISRWVGGLNAVGGVAG
jgi:hypothetical protein